MTLTHQHDSDSRTVKRLIQLQKLNGGVVRFNFPTGGEMKYATYQTDKIFHGVSDIEDIPNYVVTATPDGKLEVF